LLPLTAYLLASFDICHFSLLYGLTLPGTRKVIERNGREALQSLVSRVEMEIFVMAVVSLNLLCFLTL
jgi:hypothetical protein